MVFIIIVRLPHLVVGDKGGDAVLRAVRRAVGHGARTEERVAIHVCFSC